MEYGKISDTCLVGDGTHSTIQRHDFGVPYLTARNFKDGRLDISKLYYISEADYSKYFLTETRALACPRPNDLVFSIIGTIGEPYLVRSSDRFGISSSVAIVRPKRDLIDPAFLLYWFRGPTFQSALFGIKGGVAQGYVSLEMIKSLPVPRISLPIQRRISSILNSYDDLIEVNRRRIATLEEMARGLFDEWFVRFRFPGHEGHSIIETANGDTPRGWGWSLLGDIADVNKSSIRPATAPQRISYIDIASVSRGDVRTVQLLDFADAPGRARRKLRDGSIIWSMVRPNLRSYALIISPQEDIIASTGFAVLDSRSVPFSYLYQWVTTEKFIGYLTGNTTGAAYPAVTPPTFQRAAILVPPQPLLVSFNLTVEPILRLADTLRRVNVRLGVTRDLLLPRLLSGDLNVAAAERELEVAA